MTTKKHPNTENAVKYIQDVCKALEKQLLVLREALLEEKEDMILYNKLRIPVQDTLITFFLKKDDSKLLGLKELAAPFGYFDLIVVLEKLYSKILKNETNEIPDEITNKMTDEVIIKIKNEITCETREIKIKFKNDSGKTREIKELQELTKAAQEFMKTFEPLLTK